MFSLFICKWKLQFSDTITTVKNDKWWCTLTACFQIKNFLSTKIDFLEQSCCSFSLISEMNITLISNQKNFTYKHYLSITKLMIEWKLNAILAGNP